MPKSRTPKLPDALRDWEAFRSRLDPLLPLLLLSDYDGTLAAIKPRPDLAFLPFAVRRLLQDYKMTPGVTVGIVTGRALSVVRNDVGIAGLWYIGNHGAEIVGPRTRFVHPAIAASAPRLRELAKLLKQMLAGFPGGHVEAKRYSLSVHWREVDEGERRRLIRVFNSTVRPWKERGEIKVTRGKCVHEVRAPIRWDKGCGIEWLLKKQQSAPTNLIYIGDDVTDEDGFRMVNRYRGASIHVGKGLETCAHWRLENPTEVRAFLRKLLTWRRRHGC